MPDQVQRHGEKKVATSSRQAYFDAAGWLETPVIPRGALSSMPMRGPLIVEEYDTTIVVRPGWQAVRDDWNNVLLTTGQA